MTIRIPLRALLFFLYTAAVLGGAFGISYAVFEWRDDEVSDTSAIEQRIDDLEQQAEAGPTEAELDAQRCEAALQAYGEAVAAAASATRERLYLIPTSLSEAVDRYCK